MSLDTALGLISTCSYARTVRSPDTWVYTPPFNIIEIFFIAPFEFILPAKVYDRLNQLVMSIIFFIPLAVVALFEAQLNSRAKLKEYFDPAVQEDEDDEAVRDPMCDEEEEEDGAQISRVKFDDLVKVFPKWVTKPGLLWGGATTDSAWDVAARPCLKPPSFRTSCGCCASRLRSWRSGTTIRPGPRARRRPRLMTCSTRTRNRARKSAFSCGQSRFTSIDMTD